MSEYDDRIARMKAVDGPIPDWAYRPTQPMVAIDRHGQLYGLQPERPLQDFLRTPLNPPPAPPQWSADEPNPLGAGERLRRRPPEHTAHVELLRRIYSAGGEKLVESYRA